MGILPLSCPNDTTPATQRIWANHFIFNLMRYTFLLLFALMFMGMNALNAQTCCDKAKASTTAATSSVEKKSCDMAKAISNTASTSKCNESATASAQMPSSIATFVSGGANATKAAASKSCDPSTCDLSKCDVSKCDPANCDPSKCPKTGAMKASNTKAATKTTKAATSL